MGEACSQKWDFARKLVEDIAHNHPSTAVMSFGAFAGSLLESVPFTGDPTDIVKGLDALGSIKSEGHLVPYGKTRLLDTLMTLPDKFGPFQSSEVVYLITDGGENSSEANLAKVRNIFASSGARLFVVLVPDPPGTPARLRSVRPDEVTLGGLVKLTGGNWLNVNGLGFPRLDAAYTPCRGDMYWNSEEERQTIFMAVRNLYLQMNEYYDLTIKLPKVVAKPHDWELEVVDEKGKRQSRDELLYARQIFPCTSSASPNN